MKPLSIRLSGRLARFALEAAEVGVWELSLQTGEVYWSETCEIMHGLVPGQFGGTIDDIVAAVHPDDRDLVKQVTTDAISSGTEPNLEYRTIWLPDEGIYLCRWRELAVIPGVA